MIDMQSPLTELRRPRLLVRAARHGVPDYCRERDLRRLIATAQVPGPEAAVAALLTAEARMESTRQAGAAGYSIARHVELLIALMVEVRLFARGPASA